MRDYKAMGNWGARRLRNKKASQTPGTDKPNCQITPLDRAMARYSSSYKSPYYPQWCKKMDLRNKLT